MKELKAKKNCSDWGTIKLIDKYLELRNTGRVVKCPYCSQLHKD